MTPQESAQLQQSRGGVAVGATQFLDITDRAKPDEVAKAIVTFGETHGFSENEIVAALATGISKSGLRHTVQGDGGRYGIFQQDTSYRGRHDPNQQIREFFKRLDGKRKSAGASQDPWKNIFWLQQRPSDASADIAYSQGGQGYVGEIRRHELQASALYDRFAHWAGGPVRLSRPDNATSPIIDLIGDTEEFFNRTLDQLRGNNPKPAPERRLPPALIHPQLVGTTEEQYRVAGNALASIWSRLCDRDSAVCRDTAEVVPIASAARKKLRGEARWLNHVLEAIYGYGSLRKVDESGVYDALALATQRGWEIFVNAVTEAQTIAGKINPVRTPTTRDGSRRGY